MRLQAFLSSSFHEDDEPVIERFREILGELGIESFQAKYVPEIPDNIIQAIKERELFIAILTPRKAKEPPAYVSFEIAAALATDKKIIIFRQKDIPIQDIYSHRLQKEFDRDALLNHDSKQSGEIQHTIKEHCRSYGFEIKEINPELERRYDFAKGQAQLLGGRILGFFNEVLYRNEIRDKAVKNFPTDADERANNMIIRAIQDDALTKDDGIISEESTRNINLMRKIIEEKEYVWIIDPLDGTLNFAYGFPFFCVSLGLLHNQEPVLGVLYDPPTQNLYCGRYGHSSESIDLKSGTRRNIELKSIKNDLADCIVMSHLSSSPEPRKITVSILDEMMEKCRAVRMLGSGQRALLSIALGQFDIFFNYQTNLWDIVPGYVILKGAGGHLISSLESGSIWNWSSRGIIAAANQTIGEKFRKFLYKNLREDFPSY